jgi:YVTN family beta-propeller protein
MFPRLSLNKNFIKRVVFVAAVGLVASWMVARRDVPRASAQAQQPDYKNFESPQVHPLAITPDGMRLLAVNTPNNTLSVFYLSGGVLTLVKEIPVGLEPTSVAVRNEREAWVTNWLSDSVSVVDLANGNVVRTIDVGDEPTDVVFAGRAREMAFVCVSGLNQVKVYDPNAPTASPQLINIRGKQPRSLVRDSSGAQVFVSVFESGNETTIVPFQQVRAGGGAPSPSPAMSFFLPRAPDAGLIVKHSGSAWVDERGDARWTQFVPYTLADVDVVAIDASGATATVSREVHGVGTSVGNAAFDAASNRLYVVNTEAHNEIRFEPNLRGRFLSNRVSVINLAATAAVTPVDLNPHVNFNIPSGSDDERARSLALPTDIARDTDGTLYVAATGSARVGVLDSSGTVQARISVGQGPTGLALDTTRKRLYVLNRFDETVSVVDLASRSVLSNTPIGNNPEPATVRNGRRFLYDASFSAHGDLACASCHANGHRDGLAWDLGDPQGSLRLVNNGGSVGPFIFPFISSFHPMKGPMTTQSLRGIIGTEPLHWRGDRSSLADFNPAFVSLLGSPRQLTSSEMSAFEAFVRTLTYAPNPFQNLDRTYPNPPTGPSAARGEQLFNTAFLDGRLLTCNQCHTASPGFRSGTNSIIIPGVALQEPQDFKVPQLRGVYQKVGMQNAPGEQLSGFGFAHDGNFDSLLNFLRAPVFTFNNDNDRRDVAQFVLSFDTGIAPIVGVQVTANRDNKASVFVTDRINLLMSQVSAGNCDMVVRGTYGGARRGFLYTGNGLFQPDRQADLPVSLQTLLQAVDSNSELTFTGVPTGTGRRLGIDRDSNGVLNGDEAGRANPIDDTRFFVAQQYADFLKRDPDPVGNRGWQDILNNCAAGDTRCDRTEVSAGFFRSSEFQERGYFTYRFYSVALGRKPDYAEFIPDLAKVSGFLTDQEKEANKAAFADEFIQRTAFKSKYDSTIDNPTAYVDALLQTAGLPTHPSRAGWIAGLSNGQLTRARVLRELAESAETYDKFYTEAFVVMQYFGYLHRDPDKFYLDWIKIMNQDPANYRNMVNGFMNSLEYRQRFGA